MYTYLPLFYHLDSIPMIRKSEILHTHQYFMHISPPLSSTSFLGKETLFQQKHG